MRISDRLVAEVAVGTSRYMDGVLGTDLQASFKPGRSWSR